MPDESQNRADSSAPLIFVVDDDAAVRRSLLRLMRAAGWNAEGFGSAAEFLNRPPWPGTGCVVLDVNMPGMNGPELHQRMTELGLTLPIIFLTGNGDVPTGVRAMKNGAVDFLLKPVDDEVLLQAIDAALRRHAVQLAGAESLREIQGRLKLLSPREREVMERVIRGRLNKQIAADLGIAEKTVKVHRGQVMHKMSVRSVAELVRVCDTAGIRPA